MANNTEQQKFGGAWTQEKLQKLEKYLRAYTTIFEANPRAAFFETSYVDAFAGTGTLVAPKHSIAQLFPMTADEMSEVRDYKKGSVRRALEVEPQFDHYVFIEKDKKRYAELEQIKKEFPGRDIQVKNEDANEFLNNWCRKFDRAKSRAVVFLDPFGANVKWEAISLIAKTRAVDLWLLFPLFAVNRMLVRNEKPPASWASRLTEIFGTADWEREFYVLNKKQALLFEPNRFETTRVADMNKISEFFVARLKKEFVAVAKPMILQNSRNSPLYLFCFAAGNEKGATTGLKIAQDILGR